MTAKKELEAKTTEETLGMSEERVLASQENLIAGLLAASDFENDENTVRNIRVERNGKFYFEFNIHPLSEKTYTRLSKLYRKKVKNPNGKNLPMVDGELKVDEYRCAKIYEATSDEDKAKLWDNPAVKAALTKQGHDVFDTNSIIETVLLAGEKYNISEIIDEISGYNNEEMGLVEYSKN